MKRVKFTGIICTLIVFFLKKWVPQAFLDAPSTLNFEPIEALGNEENKKSQSSCCTQVFQPEEA